MRPPARARGVPAKTRETGPRPASPGSPISAGPRLTWPGSRLCWAASARSLRARRCASTRLASEARPRRTRIPVQRSNGSNVAAWMTRVPPATGSRRQLHSLSKPDAVTRSRKRDIGPGLEALDPGRVAQQAEPGACRARRRGGRPGRRGRAELELRKEGAVAAGSWSVAQTVARRGVDEDAPLDGAVGRRAGPVGAPACAPPPVPDRHPQPPIGCQTVFISRKAAIHSGRSAAASSSQSKRASATVVGPAQRGA